MFCPLLTHKDDNNRIHVHPFILINLVNIGFPAHFRYLFIQFHQFSIQFRPEKLTAFKSKVQFRQIVIHILFFVNQIVKIQHSNSSIVTEIRLCR